MTKNKEYRKQLQGQYRALEEHLEKIAGESSKPPEQQRQGLIAKWEKTVAVCRQQIAKLERRLSQ
ncbi:hypothetical protein K9N68_25690 [Kovacikia minuta CCNUW1]|uniref:hypothetical protein n=1 Tax=Kovacikia minuta TaxID=2931930 RepID=UPI001CCAF0C4|nr:hypothetical protein [Kovacikia minuta]UBF25002.1 hypothetical protein K9N68_25690 [Kovacikia minuta CCNUW1]